MPNYVTADNTKLYYETEGDGQPVVFIHGWSSSHEAFAGMVKTMKDKYRCISYSHRGHGASEVAERGYSIPQLARDLKELIDYLALKDVILVGHSMGGYTIYDYISQFGCDNISKVVIIDMSPKVLCDDDWKFGAFGNYDEKGLCNDMELIGQDLPKFMWKFTKQVLPSMEALPDALADLVSPGLKGINHTLPLLALWHSMFSHDYRNAIPAITVPAAYVFPEHPIYPRGAAEYFKDKAGAPAQIIEAPGCTHMCVLEKPLQIANDIMSFLEK